MDYKKPAPTKERAPLLHRLMEGFDEMALRPPYLLRSSPALKERGEYLREQRESDDE